MKYEKESIDRVARLETSVRWLTLLVVLVLALQVFVATLLTLQTNKALPCATERPSGPSPLGKTRTKRYSNRRGGVLELPAENPSNKTGESGLGSATNTDGNANSVSSCQLASEGFFCLIGAFSSLHQCMSRRFDNQ